MNNQAKTIHERLKLSVDLMLNNDECRGFQEEYMPFGRYEGLKVADIDLDYLFWIDAENAEFRNNLHRYLLSDYIQREQNINAEE